MIVIQCDAFGIGGQMVIQAMLVKPGDSSHAEMIWSRWVGQKDPNAILHAMNTADNLASAIAIGYRFAGIEYDFTPFQDGKFYADILAETITTLDDDCTVITENA